MVCSDESGARFERTVWQNLLECEVFDSQGRLTAGDALGVAVSGGADSVSLLVSLAALSRAHQFCLKVITVNHNIRAAEESRGDALFTRDVCDALRADGVDIAFFMEELAPGAVFALNEEKRTGIEACARDLRYAAFERFAKEAGVHFIALAHTENDTLETLLMRFLQGGGALGLSGIRMRRGRFVRPLLTVSRTDIEAYLTKKGVAWRTDSTNADNAYFRNRVRNELIPFLNGRFPGAARAVLDGAVKTRLENDVLEQLSGAVAWKRAEAVDGTLLDGIFSDAAHVPSGSVFCAVAAFDSLLPGVQVRVLQNGLALLGRRVRFPFRLMHSFCTERRESVNSCGIEIRRTKSLIVIKNADLLATESEFFAIIEKSGRFEFPFGNVECTVDGFCPSEAAVLFEGTAGSVLLERLPLPFCVRSRALGDAVRAADGASKRVSDVLSDWHVPELQRSSVPIVQELCTTEQEIRAVLGGIFGFPNWIVRG